MIRRVRVQKICSGTLRLIQLAGQTLPNRCTMHDGAAIISDASACSARRSATCGTVRLKQLPLEEGILRIFPGFEARATANLQRREGIPERFDLSRSAPRSYSSFVGT